jgi:uncharacterized protein YndB with AHSA1/START domain
MQISVSVTLNEPIEKVWGAYTSQDDIVRWNFASDDWHCPSASVDLRVGGAFSSRMEAKDGSSAFDFEGTYTNIVEYKLIEYSFGDRSARIEFSTDGDKVKVQVMFDPEDENSPELQKAGWQAILNNFASHVSSK